MNKQEVNLICTGRKIHCIKDFVTIILHNYTVLLSVGCSYTLFTVLCICAELKLYADFCSDVMHGVRNGETPLLEEVKHS